MEIKKIVLAPDSFKGSLSAREATEAISAGIREIFPDAEIIEAPLSDGGEGFLSILEQEKGFSMVKIMAHDPLLRQIKTEYLVSEDGETGVIESASACGLTLLSEKDRNPLKTSTFGLGEMIKDAEKRGCRNIIVTLGGSATNDGGTGMLSALGLTFHDVKGNQLEPNGENLLKIKTIRQKEGSRFPDIRFIAVTDVNNPLLGSNGCSKIYAAQKGATPEEIEILEEGMKNFANVTSKFSGKDNSSIDGAGAAGGLGFAFLSYFDAEINSGIEFMMNLVNFDEKIKNADLIITGEGSIDSQSLMGKVLSGIIRHSNKYGIPVLAFGGIVSDNDELLKSGLKGVYCINDSTNTPDSQLKPEIAFHNLKRKVSQICELYKKNLL